MVYYSGSRNARNAASITNRPTCGGNKKAGTAPRVGFFLSNNPMLIGAPQRVPTICVPNRTIQTQKYGYRATIGGNIG
jgi:hypothetical protein